MTKRIIKALLYLFYAGVDVLFPKFWSRIFYKDMLSGKSVTRILVPFFGFFLESRNKIVESLDWDSAKVWNSDAGDVFWETDDHHCDSIDSDTIFRRPILDAVIDICLASEVEYTITEAGCGAGYNLEYLSRALPNHRLYGFDPNKKVIDLCKSKTNNVDYFVAQLTSSNRIDEHEDILLLCSVLMYLNAEQISEFWSTMALSCTRYLCISDVFHPEVLKVDLSKVAGFNNFYHNHLNYASRYPKVFRNIKVKIVETHNNNRIQHLVFENVADRANSR